MLLRNLLLAFGVAAILAGAAVAAYLGLGGARPRPEAAAASVRAAVLVVARPVASGALLRQDDLAWREIEGPAPAGALARGAASDVQFVGAAARRDLAAGQLFTADSVIAPGERGFLAAVLAPGRRAVTIPVDLAQSAAGLVLPDDRVDLILVQDAGEGRSMAQTVLRDVRVVAVDRSFERPPAGAADAPAAPIPPQAGPTAGEPRTVTFELTERDAQRLFVARQLGRVELSLRALTPGGGTDPDGPVWASELSPLRTAAPAASPSVQRASAPRQPSEPAAPAGVRILRGSGSKADRP